VNRVKVVQHALEGRARRVYLEIGVSRGVAFRRITADEKIAVDPTFKLSARARKLADAKARATHYFETTSDAFFANETVFLEQRGIDVALIDGLHTYGQVVRDVENTMRYLRDDGVIVLHDCKPCARLGRLPRDVVRRLSCAEPLAGSPLAHGTSVVRRCLEGDRPPAQYAARSTNCGAELRFWRRARTEVSSGISPVLLAGTDRGAQLRGSRRRPRAFA
jgi:Methyltransferase domain